MTLASKPVQMLLAVLIAVVLGPPLGALAVFIGGFGLYAADGQPWSVGPSGLASAGGMILALSAVAYIFAWPMALAGGILVALWMLGRPPTLIVVLAAAAAVSIGYSLLRAGTFSSRDVLVTVGAALFAAAGCWFLTRRFVRTA